MAEIEELEQQGPRATSPAPGLPADVLGLESMPLVSPNAPPQPAPPIVPGATDMASIARSIYDPGGAQSRTVEALRAKGDAMAPAIDTVSAALNAPRPDRPVAPTLTEAPSRGLRPFLSMSQDEPPEASIQKLISAIGLFAMGLGGGAGAAKASLAAFTGAMAGWQAGDRERADRSFADWQAKTDTALKQWQIQNTDFDNALKERGLDFDQRMQQLKLVALKHDNSIAASELEQKGLEGLLGYLVKERDHADLMAVESGKLAAAYAKASSEGIKQDTVIAGDKQYRVTYDRLGNEINRVLIGDKPQGQGTEAERFAAAEMAWKTKPTPENKARYDEAKLGFENAERLAGAKASAAAISTITAQRGVAMDPKEAANLIHPQTLTGPPAGLSKADAISQGYREADDKDRAALADLQSTRAVVGTLTEMTKRLITATTPAEAASQWANLTAGAKTGSNALARTYEQTVSSFLGTVSRALAGERGVLTNQDIDRIRAAFPGFFDTRQVAAAKEGMLSLLIDTATRARVAKMTGQPFDETAFRSQIGTIIGNLESVATPKPGQPGSPWKPR